MRKALIVGINHYENVSSLYGCANDAKEVQRVLSRNHDEDININTSLKIAKNARSRITRKELKDSIKELFSSQVDLALFYFSGHGYIENTGGYLITSECSDGDDGFPMSELLHIVNQSKILNKIIILDCCHSGVVGKVNSNENVSVLSEGLTILTASSATQYAIEKNGSGVFTSLLVDALEGSAANLLGEITPGGVYAHIDKSIGLFGQRPIFKTNVARFVALKKVTPAVTRKDLRKITTLFPDKSKDFPLDPSFEPERSGHEKADVPQPIEANVQKFEILQKYNRVNLVLPEKTVPHMWHAAMYYKTCYLTLLGKYYWTLVHENKV